VRTYDAGGNILWTRQFGTAALELANGVVVDGRDNVYVAGSTDGALPLQTSAGGRDAYVQKFDSAGNEEPGQEAHSH